MVMNEVLFWFYMKLFCKKCDIFALFPYLYTLN